MSAGSPGSDTVAAGAAQDSMRLGPRPPRTSTCALGSRAHRWSRDTAPGPPSSIKPAPSMRDACYANDPGLR